MKKETDTLVIGAGITGLTAAYYLKKQGVPCLILDEADRVGGAIQTRRKGEFVFESGPNSGVIGQPEVAALFEDLGEVAGLEIASTAVKKRYILKKGRWEAMPMGLKDAIRTPLFTLGDKFRILGEPFRKRGNNPEETLASLVKRRMGKSFLDYAVDPFILGVYAGDPHRLVPKYALPKLYRLEQDYGSFIRGAIKKKTEKKSDWEKKATRAIFSCKNGLGTLVSALEEQLDQESIVLNAKDCQVKPVKGAYQIRFHQQKKEKEIRAKRVVVTTGAHKLPGMLPFLETAHINALIDLRYARVVEVAVGFKTWTGMKTDGFGGLIPFSEKRDILGVLFMSAFLENRAPKEGALFTVFMGGVRRPEIYDLDEKSIEAILRKEFTDLMGVDSFEPDLLEIMRYKYAIPQYEKNSGLRFQTAQELEAHWPGLFLRGNFTGGIGLADRIRQGRIIADQLGADQTVTDQFGADQIDTDQLGADPEKGQS